jgi:hypothetical protein
MRIATNEAIDCPVCGIPLDAEVFDESRVVDPPVDVGEMLSLARFELPPRYCGILQYFSQFSDLYARLPQRVRTEGLEWSLQTDGRPLAPYIGFDYVLNPWGEPTFDVKIRLDEGATIELVVRRIGPDPVGRRVNLVGGRLAGRYWYNALHGDVGR